MKWVLASVALCAAIGSHAQTPGALFARFQGLSRSAEIEDVYLAKLRSARGGKLVQNAAAGWSSPAQKVEWAARLGLAKVSVTWEDMEGVRSASLLDDGLWLLLMQHREWLFSRDPPARAWLKRFEDFLNRTPQTMGLGATGHGAWWRSFRRETVPESARDALLSAHLAYVRAMAPGNTERFRDLLAARQALRTQPSTEALVGVLDDGVRKELPAVYGDLASGLRALGRASSWPALIANERNAFLLALSLELERQGQFSLAALALAQVRRELTESEALDLAELFLLSKQYAQAVATFEAQEPEDPVRKAQRAAGLALARDGLSRGNPNDLWSVLEGYRRALQLSFASVESDALLLRYAEILWQLGRRDDAFEYLDVLYRFAKTHRARNESNVRALAYLSVRFEEAPTAPARHAVVSDAFNRMSILADHRELRGLVREARSRWLREMGRRGVPRTSDLRATLAEIEEKLTR